MMRCSAIALILLLLSSSAAADCVWSNACFADLEAGRVSPDSVQLGDDTVGNYVGTVTGDSEIVVTGADGESSTKALAIAAAIMRDTEATPITVSATAVTDPGTACDDGDVYFDTATPEICFCIDGTTDNWACATLID